MSRAKGQGLIVWSSRANAAQPHQPGVVRAGRCVSGGGRGSRGGGGGIQGGAPPPPAEMNHIHQEVQKCTTLTHSASTFAIMSEDR